MARLMLDPQGPAVQARLVSNIMLGIEAMAHTWHINGVVIGHTHKLFNRLDGGHLALLVNRHVHNLVDVWGSNWAV